MNALAAQFGRDLLLSLRSRAEAANPLAFFALAVLLLALGIGAAERDLAAAAPGAVWVLALFSNMLGVEGLFRRDAEDGTLAQLLLHAKPLFPALLGKLAANWLTCGAPVVAVGPLAAALLGGTEGLGILALSLLLGTPALTLIGAIGAALAVGTGRGGLLIAVLVMPFTLPVLIFGSGASAAAAEGASATFPLLMLAAILTAAATLAPFATGKALAIAEEA